ncbi:MAG: hypothetical protein ACLQLO_07975 [Mycobacterium sp.]
MRQWAHQVAGRFPDGQLYVNLRGFDPAGPPVTPAEAVRGFLDAFEVPAARIPVSLDAQAALYVARQGLAAGWAPIPSLGHVICETTLTRGVRAEQRNE